MSARAAVQARAGLDMWVVYDHPADYPHCFIARRWRIEAGRYGPTEHVITCPDVEDLRAELASRGFVRTERHEVDDAKILEVWL